MVCFSSPHFLPSHCPSIRCKISLFFYYGRTEREKKKTKKNGTISSNNSVLRLRLSAISQLMSSKYRCTQQLLQAAAWPTLPAAPEAQPKAALGREALWPKVQQKLGCSHSFQTTVFICYLHCSAHCHIFTVLFILTPDLTITAESL